MHITLCVDDRNGMLFNGRRLSADQVLCRRIFDQHCGRLWVNDYSAKLFEDMDILCDDLLLDKAEREDTCFVEDLAFIDYLPKVLSITIYRWNRHYPSDVKLPTKLLDDWKMIHKEEFTGSVHPTITEEKYVK